MLKDTIAKNDAVNPNDREMAVLRENFPSCFRADGTFDIERFQEYLTDKVAISHEGYELKFLGKNYARLLASVDTTTVVVPDEEHNAKPENANSQNIYISGDNLDGLKHLLKSYAHSIKCIYIDPPYNTGSDGFVYNDSFNFTADELVVKLSIEPEQAQRILDLTKRGSASHSAWLMFMYPRLLLARDLLSDDGVIFISIDDNEQANLKLLCDDVFGEENFINNFMWLHGKGKKDAHSRTLEQYVLCYGRQLKNVGEWNDIKFTSYNFENPDNDPKGKWFSGSISFSEERSNPMHPNYFSITSPSGIVWTRQWQVSKDEMDLLISNGDIYWGDSPKYDAVPRQKIRPAEIDIIPENIFNDCGTTQSASAHLIKLMGADVFDYPKPVDLIAHILKIADIKNSIIMDFFSGSATTAEAIMSMNVDEQNANKFIMVQINDDLHEKLQEPRESKTKIQREIDFLESIGLPHTLDYIGYERIIRAARKIKETHPQTTADLGFRHYILQEPSADTLDRLEKFDPNRLDAAENNFLQEFGLPTILATWLLRDGYGLTSSYEEVDLAGYKAFWKDKHLYLITNDLTRDAISALVDKYVTDGNFNPENVVLFGYSFTWTQREELKANLMRLKDTEKNLRINFDVRY